MENLIYITESIFRNPPVLLGLIAGLGLLLQKKSFPDVVKGMLLAAIGMYILQIGVDFLVGAIAPINGAFQAMLGTGTTSGMGDAVFTETYGGLIGISMVVGFLIHLLIARVTPLKNIFLTGHFLWWIPFIFFAVAIEAQMTDTSAILFAAIFSAIYWSVMPFLARPLAKKITGDDSFTLGHPSTILALVAAGVAKLVGNPEKSTEELNFPKGLAFFKEIAISGGLVIFLMYIILGTTALEFGNEEPMVMFAINMGLMFGAGLTILLQGVRMLVNQLVPAFKGISDKLVPGAIPALDCPVFFNYKPNAVILGFIVSMIVSSLLVIISAYYNWFGVILVPLVITSFFECGMAAAAADAYGGLRGTIIGTAVAAIVMVLLMGFALPFFANTIQNWMIIFGGNDLSLFGIIAGLFTGIL